MADAGRASSSVNGNEFAAPVGEPVRRSLCANCPAQPGGASSDDGTAHPCLAFEERSPIDRVRAAELGFDVDAVERLVAREFEAPLRWTPGEDGSPTPPRGYEVETRIAGDASIDSYTHVSLNPAECDGPNCTREGLGDWVCSDRLDLGVEANLRSLDGAIEAQARGTVFVGREGFPFSEYPAGTVFASLREASGTLQLFPNEHFTIASAALLTDLFFKVDQIEGDIRTEILQTDPTTGRLRGYYDLSGHWPDPR
jgi:hypothetical protein